MLKVLGKIQVRTSSRRLLAYLESSELAQDRSMRHDPEDTCISAPDWG